MVDELESDNIPWPNASDSLIGPGADWTSSAGVGWARGRPDTRIMGFRMAAELLADTIAQGRDQDVLVYPFLLCWRHHIELALKDLIEEACRLLQETTPKVDDTHSLERLWNTFCRPRLQRIDPRAVDELDNAGRLIAELHALDPIGDAFRYHVTKETKKHPATFTLPGVDNLAIDQVHKTCEGLSNLLGGARDLVAEGIANGADW
jgi:hypothetical protein